MSILLVLSLVAALIALAWAVLQQNRLRNEVAAARSAADALQREVTALSRYRSVVDAEAHARNIVEAAQQQARGDTARASGVLTLAQSEAARIVEAATQQAQQIAGDAYAAVQKAKELDQTVRALRNVIEGYGDQYIVPTYGVLDELADEFGFAEAGQRLKAAREYTRQMIKAGHAATCDYAEENRRTTAIAFVVDAFNGKVDSILADVRHDNFGTLEQKVRDAFALVNHNGRAFRDARIMPDYLKSRLDELRWAVVAQELKAHEREEQRLIKERIREEEKAQREFEKAQRDAQKEEEILRRAMEKAQRDLGKATDEQKAKYELQLAELTAKLQVAEEKNQRALSMAQQTKAGNVYVISNVGSFGEDVYKIGLTRRLDPLDRIKELGDASVPFDFDVHAMIRSDDAPALEHELHKRFVMAQVNKVNPRKEFFRVALKEIREQVERLGCAASWTMAADYREYKETQAIEHAMKEKTFRESEWAKKQIEEHDRALGEPLEVV